MSAVVLNTARELGKTTVDHKGARLLNVYGGKNIRNFLISICFRYKSI